MGIFFFSLPISNNLLLGYEIDSSILLSIATCSGFPATSPMPVPRGEERERNQSGVAICKLKKNQKLKVDAIATKGVGKLHAKWIPCATAVFQVRNLL